ncbi:MAG: CHRD domain-containing protein [Saprospiraceae bacterium]|nr:CHRD domain-containing protein [Saprospiraceae bacterium]
MYADTTVVTPDFVNSLLKSGIYANIHTAENPGGEIRGQMEPLLHVVYAFDACGGQEVQPSKSPGTSAAAVSHDRLNTMLDYAFVVDGLSGPATAAHFHVGSLGENGPVKWTLNTPSPYSGGIIPITGNDVVLMASGDVYLNVHTTMFLNGEIRGQVQQGFSCITIISTAEPLFEKQSVSPNPFTNTTELRLTAVKDFDGRLEMNDGEGALVYQEHLRIAAGEQVVPIRSESLPPGVYFVRISSLETGAFTVFKVIKL